MINHDIKSSFYLVGCIILCLIISFNGNSQISDVHYQLKYNSDSCRYDAFMIITGGSALDSDSRLLSSAEFSVTLPSNIIIYDIAGYMPLFNNEFYGGTEPAEWNINLAINSPNANPTSDYYLFSPYYDDLLHFNDLNTGDTVLLFSFKVDTIFNCGYDIRLFDALTDPGPNDPGMGDTDFNHELILGTSENLYSGNADPLYPPKPIFSGPLIPSCNKGIEIILNVLEEGCQLPYSYWWQGPNSFTSTNQNVNIQPSFPSNTGVYKVIISNAFGCIDSMSVFAESKPNAGNNYLICAGLGLDISAVHPNTGTWTADNYNPSGASVGPTLNGVANVSLNASANGTYNFIYTSGSCSDTASVIVNSSFEATIFGSDEICVGNSTSVLPSAGGYWASSNPTVASVSSNGTVTGLSAGTVTFTFTSFATGCSATTSPMIIHPIPVAEFTGGNFICPGSSTSVSPSSEGIWYSENPLIAIVNNEGVVTGISPGTTQLYYVSSVSGCISNFLEIEVISIPNAIITGNSTICIQNTTQLFPDSGGVWTSLNPDVASVNEAGLVIGLSIGQSAFYWTNSLTGCVSDTTEMISVTSGPQIVMNDSILCIGSTTLTSPNSGGLWTSSNPAIASIGTFNGLVGALSPGKVVFTFTNLTTGCFAITDTLTVSPNPELFADQNPICVGSTTYLQPSTGGIWSSLDEEIAIIFGNLVIGTGNGIVFLQFTDTITGCSNSMFFSVNERAIVSITEGDTICVGTTTQLSPSNGGTWSSSNQNVATINNEGLVTGVSQGSVFFTFTENATGCTALPSSPVIVNPLPLAEISGSTSICIGASSQLLPETGGFWQSLDNDIVFLESSSGIVTGVLAGSTSFTFTSFSTGCVSLPTENMTVLSEPEASLNGLSLLCVGSTFHLSPSTGGVWSSSDPDIAIIDNNGLVIALAAGKVNFTFTETEFGCGYMSTTDSLTVSPCFNPDFNVALINTQIYGNLNTNDISSAQSTFSPNPVLISGPSGSMPILNLNGDGSYTFESDIAGVYLYESEVCINSVFTDCPTSNLKILVVDPFDSIKSVSANPDISGTSYNTAVQINTLKNDTCILVGGCVLDPSSVLIIDNPVNGNAIINLTSGIIEYTPDSGFIGLDILSYQVCVFNASNQCDTAYQFISVRSPGANNSVILSDDFITIQQDKMATGNVLINDYDPEGDNHFVTPQNITVAQGTFVINSNGDFIFNPSNFFIGTVGFEYEVCDNNADSYCLKATLYILVLPDLTLKLKVYLEGATLNYGNATASDGRPLMRDNLRVSPFNGSKVIPNSDPYSHPTELIDITNKFTKVGPGQKSEFQHIPNPGIVFAVSGQDAIVDWVFVELRSKSNYANVIATRSGLLQRDGDIVELDGVSSLRFPEIKMDDYFVAVRHRNHLGVMTQNALTAVELTQVIDFRLSSTPTFDFGTTKGNGYDYTGLAQKPVFGNAYRAMWAGDFDASRRVKSGNPNDDLNILFFDVIMFPQNPSGNANYDFVIGYLQGDFDMNSKSKFDNPNDDKNMLFGQVLFYPLNANLLSNFNFMIEQLP
jgi:uncharacterized protein YjdB